MLTRREHFFAAIDDHTEDNLEHEFERIYLSQCVGST